MPPFIKQTIDITLPIKCLKTEILVKIGKLTLVRLQLDVRRVADDDIEAVLHAEHPFGIEEVLGDVEGKGIPLDEAADVVEENALAVEVADCLDLLLVGADLVIKLLALRELGVHHLAFAAEEVVRELGY